jgi:hypothetical protein
MSINAASKGLPVDIIGGKGNGKRLLLMEVDGKPIDGGIFEPSNDLLPCIIVKRSTSFGEFQNAVRAELKDGQWVPLKLAGLIGPMMDGEWIESGDSRFAAALGEGAGARPIAFHDRWETPAQYAALSC